MKTIRVLQHNGYYFPIADLRKAGISNATIAKSVEPWSHRFYDEKACANCQNLDQRHDETCDTCPSFEGAFILAGQTKDNEGNLHLKVPCGDQEKVEDLLTVFRQQANDKIKFVLNSLRPDPKKVKIKSFKLLGEVRKYQDEAVDVCIENERGVLKSPPRSGKTFMAVRMISKVRQKTLILAHQREWLDQFYATFYGSASQPRLTDIADGRVGFCSTVADFKKYDVCLATAQQFFNSNGRAVLEKIKSMFGIVICDEVQYFPAKCSAAVLTRLNSNYCIGLSGTPERKKEETFNIVSDLMGPIVHSVEVERLKMTMDVVETPFTYNLGGGNSKIAFTRLTKKLECDPKRIKFLAELALRKKNEGHTVLITLTRVEAIKALASAINALDTESPSLVAAPFWGGLSKKIREKTLAEVKSGEIPILVGNAKLISVGLNIPRASCLIDAFMSSNIPNCDQRVSRILTPMKDKKPPLYIRLLDKGKVLWACFQNEYYNCILPRHAPMLTRNTIAVIERKGNPNNPKDY